MKLNDGAMVIGLLRTRTSYVREIMYGIMSPDPSSDWLDTASDAVSQSILHAIV